MNRRHATLLITAAIAAPTVVFAADTDAEKDHATKTMAAGGVSLEASKIAQSKAKDTWVKKFSDYEVAEQTTIAEILKSMGTTAAPRTEKQNAMLEKLKSSQSFDADYLKGQTEGHNDLLQIQESYISKGKNAANVNLAKLARGQIKEHIDLISTIRNNMKA